MTIRLRARRGMAARRLDTLDHLRAALCVEAPPAVLLGQAARVAASAFGDYCIADMVDRHGATRRVAITHPDESRGVKLEVAVAAALENDEPNTRVERLLDLGRGEMIARVSSTYRTRSLSDVTLLAGESVRSYMAAVVSCAGAPAAVITLARVHDSPSYRVDERAFLETIAGWTGLAMENASRRERPARTATGRFNRFAPLPTAPFSAKVE